MTKTEVNNIMSQLVRIIPPPAGLHAVIYDDDGNRKAVPLIALGLTKYGEIQFLYIGNGGAKVRKASEVTYLYW